MEELRFAMANKCHLMDVYVPRDYGMSGDCELPCHRRRERLPFGFMPGLWEKLEARKQALSTWTP